MFWVISVYFNVRNILPKSGTFPPGHPIYRTSKVAGGVYESKPWRVEAGEEDNIQDVFVIVSLSTTGVTEMLLHRKPVSAGNLDSVLPLQGLQASLRYKMSVTAAVLRGKVNTYSTFSAGNNIK